jgi:hypothetical protein
MGYQNTFISAGFVGLAITMTFLIVIKWGKSESQKILEIRCYRNYWTLKMHNLTFFAVDCLMTFSAVDRHYNYRLPSPLTLHAYMNCVNSNLPNIHNPRSRIEARLNGIHQHVSYERPANLVSPFA